MSVKEEVAEKIKKNKEAEAESSPDVADPKKAHQGSPSTEELLRELLGLNLKRWKKTDFVLLLDHECGIKITSKHIENWRTRGLPDYLPDAVELGRLMERVVTGQVEHLNPASEKDSVVFGKAQHRCIITNPDADSEHYHSKTITRLMFPRVAKRLDSTTFPYTISSTSEFNPENYQLKTHGKGLRLLSRKPIVEPFYYENPRTGELTKRYCFTWLIWVSRRCSSIAFIELTKNSKIMYRKQKMGNRETGIKIKYPIHSLDLSISLPNELICKPKLIFSAYNLVTNEKTHPGLDFKDSYELPKPTYHENTWSWENIENPFTDKKYAIRF